MEFTFQLLMSLVRKRWPTGHADQRWLNQQGVILQCQRAWVGFFYNQLGGVYECMAPCSKDLFSRSSHIR